MQSAGGEDTTVQAEVDLLISRGHNVKVLLFENSISHGLKSKLVAGWQSIYNRTSAAKLSVEVKQFSPDIIHVHNFFFVASPAVFWAARKHKIPVVATIQNYRLICANALLLRDNQVCELCVHHLFPWHGIRHKCYHHSAVASAMVGAMSGIHKLIGTWKKKVDAYIVPAQFIGNRLLDSSLQLKRGQVKVKRNFIDDPGFSGFDNRENFYLFVGRLSAEKGVKVLLESFKDLNVGEVVIVGDGPDEEILKREFGHLDHVKFAGRKAKGEVIALMKACKALIFPSIWYEGLPLTIIEALATGTPVIASALGAMTEMLSEGDGGLLFEAGNVGHLRQAIESFEKLGDAGRQAIGEAARKIYQDRYHPTVCYQQIIDIYTGVINTSKNKVS
ncbi:glycosyltransferase family 4 protein [Paraflavitalea sp. CAU 1676]|uniref:glycosyltransferase family 4 protein n=1 Tax=Paraflavitalea sp. CAU 1676 TaxID=3032598 RepID=UPI0023DBC996|nr:glycosyltransferase family 4 protein [Paraflavitalea sp. CAU 1676]MDF2187459.1 glycosyltransferase family 4 protein [Paraflavitalea sp. CAU 1676]